MQNKIIIIALLLTGFVSTLTNKSFASNKGGKEKAVIQTSAQCESCQKRIETALKKIDGIKSADLNLDNKKVNVVYDPSLITLDKIKEAITNAGYDADDLKANTTAYDNLPGCCKKGGKE